MKLAYLGPKGSFSYQALKVVFPAREAEFEAVATIEDIIEQYELGRFDFALIPIENSIEGAVTVAVDKIFLDSEATVVAEIVLPIIQNILVAKENLDAPIQKIFSHPQALAQTREYLRAHFPAAELEAVASTAYAAQLVKENPDKAYAAVAISRRLSFMIWQF